MTLKHTLKQRLGAEFLGTAGLLMIVVGSGIMAENLAAGNTALALLANSLATGAGLYALIQTFGSVSGAHFNPVVSLVELLWKKLAANDFIFYCLAQCSGAMVGVWLAHLMFDLSLFQLSTHDRGGFHLVLAEGIASGGLLLVIGLSGRKNVEKTPAAVSLYIMSAYWFTSSTSFANPAVTLGRIFTNTFAGILWTGAFGFILAQIIGALVAFWIAQKITED